MEKIVCPKCKSNNVKDLGAANKNDNALSKMIDVGFYFLNGLKSKHTFQCANCKHTFIAEK